jgi:polyhydroxyalkanoate synthesis regulator phasin
MATRDPDNLFAKLRQLSEEGLASFFNEVMGNDSMRKALGRAGEHFMANKHKFDRNVETFLDLVNIPSKRDVRELKSRLDYLNGQVVNLSMKVDRLLAQKAPAPSKGSRKP